MKVAVVHELLTMRGGAEKVLRILAQMFPEAPIYTLLYDEKKLGDWFPKERVRTSRLQRSAEKYNHFPFSRLHVAWNHHLYLKRFPAAVEAWDFSEFDLVISNSSAFTHGIITNGKPLHLCFVESPARYLWDRTHDVMGRAGTGILGPLKRAYLSHAFHKLRVWDAEAADRPDRLLAASGTVQGRINAYWRRQSTVLYPPIDDFWFEQSSPKSLVLSPQSSSEALSTKNTPYYCIASTLVPYKRIELAIGAANRLKVPLLIAGEGPDRRRLESLAGPTVEFLGYRTQEELRDLYAGATATLFPGDEDFGLVPLESLACGTPVIAFASGGAKETLDARTAAFFGEPTESSLAAAMERFPKMVFSRDLCKARARDFSRPRFEAAILKEVQALLGQN